MFALWPVPISERQTYQATGAESLLPADEIRILARVLGRNLRFDARSDGHARQEMRRNTLVE